MSNLAFWVTFEQAELLGALSSGTAADVSAATVAACLRGKLIETAGDGAAAYRLTDLGVLVWSVCNRLGLYLPADKLST